MMADILGLPITLGGAEETGALGAAIAAAVGIGHYPTVEAAVAAMTKAKAQLSPDPRQRALHDHRFAVWERLTAAIEPFWADLAELGEP